MSINVEGTSHIVKEMKLLELEYTTLGAMAGIEAGIALVTDAGTVGKFTLTTSILSEESATLLQQLIESLERDAATHIFPGASQKAGITSF